MTRPGIEPRSPGPLLNNLLIRPMALADSSEEILRYLGDKLKYKGGRKSSLSEK